MRLQSCTRDRRQQGPYQGIEWIKGSKGQNAPPADNLSLLSSDGNVVADDDESDAIGLVGVKGGVLLFGESKVENVAGIVPCIVNGRSGNRPMGLLYDDDRAGRVVERREWRAVAATHPTSLLTKSIARRTWRALGEANTFPQTAAGVR